MCRAIAALVLMAALTLTGCGSSSPPGPSEVEADRLARDLIGLSGPQCVQVSGGSNPAGTSGDPVHQITGPRFTCSGSRHGRQIPLEVTVSESGDALVIDHCDHLDHALCKELGQGGGSIGG